MCSRLVLVTLILVAGIAGAQERTLGGRSLEFGVNAGWIDFDPEIRFDDDLSVSASVLAEVLPFLSLGVELARVGAYDRQQEIYQDLVVASLRGRIEPWRDSRFNGGMALGVTFLGFENRPGLDSVSEGFELGATGRWNIDGKWRLRVDGLLRLQTVNRPRFDAEGRPTGESDDTGFVWSQVYRVGVARGF